MGKMHVRTTGAPVALYREALETLEILDVELCTLPFGGGRGRAEWEGQAGGSGAVRGAASAARYGLLCAVWLGAVPSQARPRVWRQVLWI